MLQDELKEIRTQLRMAMNGVIATSMREKGIDYKLNFGVPLPEIKQIAAIVISRIIILYIIVRQTASILIHSS